MVQGINESLGSSLIICIPLLPWTGSRTSFTFKMKLSIALVFKRAAYSTRWCRTHCRSCENHFCLATTRILCRYREQLPDLPHLPYRNQRRWHIRDAAVVLLVRKPDRLQPVFLHLLQLRRCCSRGSSGDFFYLNANLHAGPNVFFHNEQDVEGSSCYTWKTGSRSATCGSDPLQEKATIQRITKALVADRLPAWLQSATTHHFSDLPKAAAWYGFAFCNGDFPILLWRLLGTTEDLT
ncbi:hypothetical protein AVEN_6758-1 [Araneus ventricosus]|uniref:Uncharacterized protein n=1 Tax=Araneus ventricosus TaxID=182803 RepID=A0A4Y2W797_ARAVE|nr:hypothetical protein AVEN_6758-1 [Araneus ventricosus]